MKSLTFFESMYIYIGKSLNFERLVLEIYSKYNP